MDIKSRGGRHKDLLGSSVYLFASLRTLNSSNLSGIFFDCFEALRIKEIEAAKRDLERCRQDRIAIMVCSSHICFYDF